MHACKPSAARHAIVNMRGCGRTLCALRMNSRFGLGRTIGLCRLNRSDCAVGSGRVGRLRGAAMHCTFALAVPRRTAAHRSKAQIGKERVALGSRGEAGRTAGAARARPPRASALPCARAMRTPRAHAPHCTVDERNGCGCSSADSEAHCERAVAYEFVWS